MKERGEKSVKSIERAEKRERQTEGQHQIDPEKEGVFEREINM